MNKPQNQHWFPQCAMKPWRGTDNLVESLSLQSWGLSMRRKSTESLGSDDDIYKLRIPGSDVFEELFRNIETNYAAARNKAIVNGVRSLSDNERQNLAFFVALLPYRKPDIINNGTLETASYFRSSLAINGSDIEKTTVAAMTSEAGKFVSLQASVSFAAELSENLIQLQWRIFDFGHVDLKLVLSDRPVRVWGNSGRLGGLSFPLHPNHLLVIGKMKPHEEVIFEEKFREVLALKTVGDQFRQAEKFVICTERDRYQRLATKILTDLGRIRPKGTL